MGLGTYLVVFLRFNALSRKTVSTFVVVTSSESMKSVSRNRCVPALVRFPQTSSTKQSRRCRILSIKSTSV